MHTESPLPHAASPRGKFASRREVAASFIGTSLEYYDYFIYGTAAALVFPYLFFSIESDLVATLASFATFAVAFVVRPVGAAVFGHFGDLLGRQRVLVITVLLMGGATFAIGLLPTYETIGILAPILLVVLRVLQGLGLGGEWSGAVLLTTENSAPERRGFAGSWTQMGSPLGLLLSTAVFAVASALPGDSFLGWGWRVPFLLSIVLVIFGVWVRTHVGETDAFTKVKESGVKVAAPIAEVFRRHPRNFVCGVLSRVGIDTTFYLVSVYSLNYFVEAVQGDRGLILTGLLIAAALSLVTMPLFGWLSDRLSQRKVLIAGLAFMAAFSVPFFSMIETGNGLVVVIAMILGYSVGISAGFSPFAGFLTHLFSSPVRYSGTALTFQVAGILGGGIAPTVAVLLYAWAGSSLSIAIYWSGVCVISILAMLAIREFHDDEADLPQR